MQNPFSENSPEFQIFETLNKLIDDCSVKFYTKEFQESIEFKNPKIRLDALGQIVSKFCQWDGDKIETVAMAAFEDSNIVVKII